MERAYHFSMLYIVLEYKIAISTFNFRYSLLPFLFLKLIFREVLIFINGAKIC